MVMELLGPSLEDLFQYCSRSFSLKTVLLLAMQMIDRIEHVHNKEYLHRDIKPDNFAMGSSARDNQVYIIDFGLADRYIIGLERVHIPFKTGNSMTGTARYSSANALRGVELSRRDDLISLGYILIYFLRGQLPWQGLIGPGRIEKVIEMKQSIKPEELCKDCPNEFAEYLSYCLILKFKMKPDYETLRRSLSDLFTRMKYVNDNIYDWNKINTDKKEKSPDDK
ncbi:casein kinase I [Drosophila innubila]|uniref:casein kinase I n=1 Tax=Drosophila innubila TaxID=198719 RepID=UPI00148C5264|nr:casein kinase I [Drosophila innubila]